MLDLRLVEVANGTYDTKLQRLNTIKNNSLKKAKQYHRRAIMKNIATVIVAIFIIILIGLVGNMELHAEPDYVKEQQEANYYPTTGIITTVSTEFVVFTDFNGNEWMIEDSPEDWECGDICSVIMDSNGTDIIYDDSVVSTKYSGWIY